MFGADLVIDSFEVNLYSLQSEAMSYRLVGSNMVLFLLGIEEDDNCSLDSQC